jgi:hypothetical protein
MIYFKDYNNIKNGKKLFRYLRNPFITSRKCMQLAFSYQIRNLRARLDQAKASHRRRSLSTMTEVSMAVNGDIDGISQSRHHP